MELVLLCLWFIGLLVVWGDSILKLNQIEIGYGISKGKLSCGTLYRGYVAGALTGGAIGAYMPI